MNFFYSFVRFHTPTYAMKFAFRFPISGMILLVCIGMAFEVYLTYHGGEISSVSNYLWTACFSLCVAVWIEIDRKAKVISAPFEYQAFVFFLWPFIAPYYLFQTRGWRGLFQGVGLVLFSCLPGVAALITYWLVSECPKVL